MAGGWRTSGSTSKTRPTWGECMSREFRAFTITAALLAASFATGPAAAQKQVGILKMYTLDSPASMSIHEEATIYAERPMMGVFNNLVMFDQHVPQNSLKSIVPDLAIELVVERRGDRA